LLFLSCACVSVSGVLFSVGVCVCVLLIFLSCPGRLPLPDPPLVRPLGRGDEGGLLRQRPRAIPRGRLRGLARPPCCHLKVHRGSEGDRGDIYRYIYMIYREMQQPCLHLKVHRGSKGDRGILERDVDMDIERDATTRSSSYIYICRYGY